MSGGMTNGFERMTEDFKIDVGEIWGISQKMRKTGSLPGYVGYA